MNTLQDKANMVEEERYNAEYEVDDLNDQLYKMKYDQLIKNKYVFDTLMQNKKDALSNPKNYFPELMPKRKTLNYLEHEP